MQEKRKIQFRSFDGGDPSSSVDENEHNSIPNDDITETYYGEWNNNSRHGLLFIIKYKLNIFLNNTRLLSN